MSDQERQPRPTTSDDKTGPAMPAEHRLDSWKEIAAHLKRDVRTVQLWEKNEGLPVRRHRHSGRASVYAYASELEAWREGREAVAAAPDAASPEPPEAAPVSPSPSRGRAWMAWLTVAVVTAVLAGIVGTYLYRRSRPSHVPVPHGRPSVAVLGFRNISGRPEKAWISTALSEMITTELAAGEKLRVVSGEDVARMKADLVPPDVSSFAPDTLARIHSYLNTDDVVLGSYVSLADNEVRADLRLQDALTGETVTAISRKGTIEQLDELATSAGSAFRATLGAGEITTEEATAVRATLPSNPEAARLYSEGLAKLRASDNLEARDLLQNAVAAEPSFALAHSALGGAWSALGYDAKARDEAATAFSLSKNLSREDRLGVEGRYWEMAKQWDKATQVYEQLSDLFPDSVDYRLRLSNSEAQAGKGKEALAALDALRRLPPPAGEDPRIDLAEANAAFLLGDFKREQTAAGRAAEEGKAANIRLLTARALVDECRALRHLAQLGDSTTACDAAQGIFEGAGDQDGAAKALLYKAITLEHQGDYASAKQSTESAYSVYSLIGDERGMANTLTSLGVVASDVGDMKAARQAYEQALPLFREIGDKVDEANTLGNISTLLEGDGQLTRAAQIQQQEVNTFRDLANQEELQFWLTNLGITLFEEGNLTGAERDLDEAVALGRSSGEQADLANSLSAKGDLLLSEGNLPEARKAYQEALDINGRLGAKDDAASNQVSLANVAIEEGNPLDAEARVPKQITVCQQDKLMDQELIARTTLVRALLVEGKKADARRQVAAAQPIAAKAPRRGFHLDFAIVAARVHAAFEENDEARKELQAALKQATSMGFLELQFKARLALGEVEMKSAEAPAARAHLVALEKDAKAKGFLLIARKADAEARP